MVASTAAVVDADLVRDAEVHLAARVGVDVERRTDGTRRKRVRACRDRLGLQRLGRPARRHLGRHDAVEVLLETDDVDRPQLPVDDVDEEPAAVGARERERRALARHERRSGGGSALPPIVRAGRSVTAPAASAWLRPAPSRTVNGHSEESVSVFFLSARSTRIVETGAGPSVVPG